MVVVIYRYLERDYDKALRFHLNDLFYFEIRGILWHPYDVHFEEVRERWDVIGRSGVGGSECSDRPIFILFIKQIYICTMTKHHAESNINNILLTRNLPIDYWLWCQTVKPSFKDTIALVVV